MTRLQRQALKTPVKTLIPLIHTVSRKLDPIEAVPTATSHDQQNYSGFDKHMDHSPPNVLPLSNP